MKEIQVTVTKFEAVDGKVFDRKDDCIHHEEMLSGKRVVCPVCRGTRYYREPGPGGEEVLCPECKGNGWVKVNQETKAHA
jgi:uncharacterized protein YbaR (Trm112 family)